jgi:hypothetical protein
LQYVCRYIIFLFLTLSSFVVNAQDEDTLAIVTPDIDAIQPRQRTHYLFTTRVSVTVPHPMGNSSFKKTFAGIYEVNAGLNLHFYKGVYAGVSFKNNLLRIDPKKIPNYNAGMVMNCAAVRIGNDFYLNEKNTGLMSVSIAAGQNSTSYHSLSSKDPNKHPEITGFKSLYFEPEASLFLYVEPNFALGLSATYTVIKRTFDPYELCLNDWTGYSKNNSGPTRYLSFGFGLYYGFTRK